MDKTDELAQELYSYWSRGDDLLNATDVQTCPVCGAEQPKSNTSPVWRNLNTNQQLVWISLARLVLDRFANEETPCCPLWPDEHNH